MWSAPEPLAVSDQNRATLTAWINARNSPRKIVLRARIVLLAAEGKANQRIAQELGTSRPTVILWRDRFTRGGPPALLDDAPGRGRKPTIPAAKVKAIVEAARHTRPANATHWSVRTMAAAQGVSPATVQRIWHAHGLQPHRTETSKRVTDKQLTEKFTDVVGTAD